MFLSLRISLDMDLMFVFEEFSVVVFLEEEGISGEVDLVLSVRSIRDWADGRRAVATALLVEVIIMVDD